MTYAWFDVTRNAGIARIMHMSYRSKTYTWKDVILVKRSMIRVFIMEYLFSFDTERYKRGPELKIIDMRVPFRDHYFGFSGTLWLPFSGFQCEVLISDKIFSPILASGTWRQHQPTTCNSTFSRP